MAPDSREAQAGLSGAELRRLSRRRGDAVAALVARAKDLALAEGQSVSDAVLEEVTATLEAALADPAAAEALQRGRLGVALRYSGLGLEVAPSAPGVSSQRTRPDERGRAAPAPAGGRRSAQRRLNARPTMWRASASLGEAEDEHRAIRQRLEEAEAAVHALRAAEAEAVQRVTRARKEHRSTVAALHRLERAAERLE